MNFAGANNSWTATTGIFHNICHHCSKLFQRGLLMRLQVLFKMTKKYYGPLCILQPQGTSLVRTQLQGGLQSLRKP